MSHFSIKIAPRVAVALTCALVVGAYAQATHDHAAMTISKPTTAAATATMPALPVAPVVRTDASSITLPYESVFTRYQSYRDEKAASWREANETVSRIGGWRAYAKEAQQPDQVVPTVPVAPTSPPSQTAKPSPHAGHGSKP